MALKLERGSRSQATTLPSGYQLRLAAVDSLPPGTIIRVDGDGRSEVLEPFSPARDRQDLGVASRVETLTVTASSLGKVFGGFGGSEAATKVVRLELRDVVRDSVSGDELDRAIDAWLSRSLMEAGARYFIVREVLSASAVALLVDQAGLLAMEAFLELGHAPSRPFVARDDGTFALLQPFEGRLGVVVLVEEIAPVSAGLGGGVRPTIGRVPVTGPVALAPPDYATRRVLFATDRNFTGAVDAVRAFGVERGELGYGSCLVSIPRDHRMGHLESPSIWRLQFVADPSKHVTVIDLQHASREDFLADLATQVASAPSRTAMLFVHGYDVSFEDAARRTAQIAYDVAFSGVSMFYSWPSQATRMGYLADEQMSEWSEPHIKAVLADVLQQPSLEKLFLIAHSMGNRAVTRMVGALLAERPEFGPKLAEIILAAPDIDAEVFARDIAPAMTRTKCSITLYASSADKALQASKLVHKGRRAGDTDGGVVTVAGIETIDASRVDTGFVSHSYFAEHISVIGDIFNVIQHGQRADSRFGLQAIDNPGGRYWEFRP